MDTTPIVLSVKGDYNSICNRTACSNGRAVFYNLSTRKYYCPSCAKLINEANKADSKRLYNSLLCILIEPGEEFKQYHIHHSTGDKRFTEAEIQPREYAGFVYAKSLGDAYARSQNWEQPWNEANPCRSTSVGDIIQDDADFHLVMNMGFKKLEVGSDAPQYIGEQEDNREPAEPCYE